ncbi:MAG TPA: CoA transferase, partial [Dehalococcoidales bacterium]|nr:CoA transferase [Dehalococcoidales bacterium]
KRGITLNLASPEGQKVLYRLLPKADVFLHNFRPGIPERLKVGYATLKKINPRIIYASASGFGEKGPDAEEGAMDMIGMARAGATTLLGGDDNPTLPHYGGLADQLGAIFTAYGIMSALVARERTGKGQKVETSLMGSLIFWQGLMLGKGFYLHKPTVQQKRTSAKNALWNYYKTKDGKWIVLTMLQSQRHWPIVCKELGLEKLINDPRFDNPVIREKNCAELITYYDKAFMARTAAEWQAAFHGQDVISNIIASMNDLQDDPQVIANDFIIDYQHNVLGPIKVVGLPVKLSETPGEVIAEAPEFGQHTEEVLMELGGYTWEEITELREKKAI